MTNEELDKLSKLVAMTETCAKLGGTPQFSRIQGLVAGEIEAFLSEIDPEKSAVRPLAQPQRPTRVNQPASDVQDTDNGRRV